jgi:hypothetical protein
MPQDYPTGVAQGFRACEEIAVVSAFRRTYLVRLKPDATRSAISSQGLQPCGGLLQALKRCTTGW